MSIVLAGSTRAYTPDDDQLSGLSIELAAFDGEIGNGTLPFGDQAAALTVSTGRQAKISEGSTLLTDGFMLDQDRDRGPVPAGTARQYNFGLADANALLGGFRVTRSRPSETDYARVIAFAGLDGPAWDTTWVLNSATVTMPAKKYDSDGGWTGELISDLVEFTGKTLFLHDKADGSGRCLHYHVLTSGHTCGLTISDVIPEDQVTNFYPWQPVRTRTSIDLRNDVKGRDQAGRTSIATDSTSIAAHDADGLQHQALIDFEATSQGDLDVKTAAFLASQKDDLDTYTCSIGPLDEDALALIRVGDLIDVTSTVMGLTSSTQRIAHMTLSPVIGDGGHAKPGFWMAHLEMGAPIRRRARVKARQLPPITEPFTCIPVDFTVLSDAALPQIFAVISTHGCGQDAESTDFVKLYEGATYRLDYEVFHSATSVGMWATLADMGSGPMGSSSGLVPGTGNSPMIYMGDKGRWCQLDPTPDDIALASTDFTVSGFGVPGYVQATAYLTEGGCTSPSCDSFASSISVTTTYLSGPDPRFEDLVGTCANGEPGPGQPVHDLPFDGDGTTDSGTTVFGYAPGSLVLLVNGIDWTDQVTEVSPPAGTYSVAYPFPLGATIELQYRNGS